MPRRGRSGEDAAETVETHLFAALRATRLIAADATWAQCGYSRCGRTDKGVSALRQLVALKLRGAAPGAEALDYVALLNRQLPHDIRVLSWRLAPEGFSARFRHVPASFHSHAATHASLLRAARGGGSTSTSFGTTARSTWPPCATQPHAWWCVASRRSVEARG